MIEKMMERIAILTGLPMPDSIPVVREVPWEELWNIRRGAWAVYLRPTADEPDGQVLHVHGYAHLIPHEFTHHVQTEAGKPAASQECEKEAYWVQAIYFRLFPDDFQKEWNP